MKVFAVLCLAAVAMASLVPLEPARDLNVQGWSPSTHTVDLKQSREVIIALKQRNLPELERRFWAYSDPQNVEYGKSMTVDEITELVSAPEAVQAAVASFLAKHGLTFEMNANKDMVLFSATLEQLETMFAVKFTAYKHVSGRRVAATAGPVMVPQAMAEHVAFVSGVVGTPTMHKRRTAGHSIKSEAQQAAAQPWWMAKKVAAKGERNLNQENVPFKALGKMSTTSVYNPGDEMITPDIIRSSYGLPYGLVGTNANNLQAVAEFQGQYYSPADLAVFFEKYVNYTDVTTIAKVIGYNQPGEYVGIEANLDTQYIMGVGAGIQTWFYSMANFDFFHDITKWLYKLNTDTVVPWVNSVSYGEQGNYPAAAYRLRIDAEFMKLGTRRVSVIFASGDSGSGCLESGGGSTSSPSYDSTSSPSYDSTSSPYGDSTSSTSSSPKTTTMRSTNASTYKTSAVTSYGASAAASGGYTTTMKTGGSTMTKGSFTTTTGGTTKAPTATTGGASAAATTSVTSSYGETCTGISLNPSFPATSIYVTAVGATRFITGNSGEQGSVIQFKSGGGFDPLFPRPSYQEAAVAAYLASGVMMPPTTAFNSSNRANPDVSALGAENFQVIVHGRPEAVGGTSCSAPTFSGIISLLNDVLLNAGKPTLGFLNPWLYQTWAADPTFLTDITKGNSVCPSGGYGSSGYGSSGYGSSSSAEHDNQALVPGHAGDWCGFYCTTGWDPVTGLGTPYYPSMLANLPTSKQ